MTWLWSIPVGKKREQALPVADIHSQIHLPSTNHSFTIYDLLPRNKDEKKRFHKKFGLPLWPAFILNYSLSWKTKTWSTRPLFMCLPSKPIKLWRVACSIRKFSFLKVRWDVLYILQYGGSAKFRSTRKFSKDRSRVLSIYTLLNLLQHDWDNIWTGKYWLQRRTLFQLSQVVSDITYLGVGHFAGTFPALSEIYIIQPHPQVPALLIGDKNQTHYDEYQRQ